MVLLPLLGLLAGGAIAVAVLQALSGEVQSPAAAATPRGDGSVVLDADDYVGRPIDEVRNALLQLGLDVQPVGVARSDLPPGEVLDVDPSGEPLDDGDTVVVTYAVAPSGPSAPRGGGTGGGATGAAVGEDPAATGVAEPTEQAPVAEEPTPTGDAGPTEQPGTPQPTETAPPDGTTAPTTPTESTGGTTSSPATDGEL
jgi:serine/threonine-protein kinase